MVMTAWADFLLLASNYREEVNAVWMSHNNFICSQRENAQLLDIKGWYEFAGSEDEVIKWYDEINKELFFLVKESTFIVRNDVIVAPYLLQVEGKKDPVDVVAYSLEIGKKFGDRTFNLSDNPAKKAFEKMCFLNSVTVVPVQSKP